MFCSCGKRTVTQGHPTTRHITDFLGTIFLTSCSLLSFTQDVVGQSQDSSASRGTFGIVDTVVVTGNRKTKDYVILDEMTLQPGSVATQEIIEYDRNRIYSLGLFNRVDIWCEPSDDQLLLRIDVSERWYIIPLPVFGFADGDPKKPFYGGGVLHNNFRGRNQKIFGLITFGYNPSLSLSFRDPQIDRDNGLSFSGSFSFARIRNKSVREASLTGDFNEMHYNINATIGKRFNIHETLGMNTGFQIVHIKEYRPGRTVSPDGADAFLFAGLSYVFDSRDLREYAMTGGYVFLGVTKLGFGESPLSFTRFNIDARRYIPVFGDLTIASRLHGTIVSGTTIPTYARAYFGYGERIRGYFRTVLEGEDLAGASLEVRYMIFEPRTFMMNALPLPAEFSEWRFGIALALFVDSGVAWFRGEELRLSDFSSGYGAGIDFLLPYSFVVRTEYAWNELSVGQFIVDFRASF